MSWAVVGAGDVHLDLKAMNAGIDGFVKGGSGVHNVECGNWQLCRLSGYGRIMETNRDL